MLQAHSPSEHSSAHTAPTLPAAPSSLALLRPSAGGELQESNLAPLDLLSIIRTENPQLARRLASKRYALLVWLLAKVIAIQTCQQQLARLAARAHKKASAAPLSHLRQYLYKELKIQITVENSASLKKLTETNKPTLFVANHTLGILDGLVLVEILSHYFPLAAKVMANRLALATGIFNDFFIPVGVFTPTTRAEGHYIRKVYESSLPIVMFPAGLVARKEGKNLKEKPWKPQFLRKAMQFKRRIVPTYVEAENSKLFYRIHRLRSLVKIKSNLEMFLLLRECVRAHKKPIKVRFGAPIDYERLTLQAQTIEQAQGSLFPLASEIQAHVESKLTVPLRF